MHSAKFRYNCTMPALSLRATPAQPTVGLLSEPQVCYLLLTIGSTSDASAQPVNWAFVADASRSMRIPIVDEAQFRALIREGGAQEVLVDGVPVWQLSSPVPADVRAAASNALDYVARALHSIVERLDGNDRFALIACAEEAVVLNRSTSGAARAELARGIGRLASLNLGEQTDLARGIERAIDELRQGRQGSTSRIDRLLLLTDGFTQNPEACLALASAAAADGIAISTIGLGGEFQDEVLTALADRSGGRALFLHTPDEIPRAIAAELEASRNASAHAVSLTITPGDGMLLRRVTQIRPTLTTLHETNTLQPVSLVLGDLAAKAQISVLLEFLVVPRPAGCATLAEFALATANGPERSTKLDVCYQASVPAAPAELLDAAARAAAARLQRRAQAQAAAGSLAEAARLMRAAATRFEALGERELSVIAREQAENFEQGRAANALITKQLTYATRRLGET